MEKLYLNRLSVKALNETLKKCKEEGKTLCIDPIWNLTFSLDTAFGIYDVIKAWKGEVPIEFYLRGRGGIFDLLIMMACDFDKRDMSVSSCFVFRGLGYMIEGTSDEIELYNKSFEEKQDRLVELLREEMPEEVATDEIKEWLENCRINRPAAILLGAIGG